jgi:hypothetical protein
MPFGRDPPRHAALAVRRAAPPVMALGAVLSCGVAFGHGVEA